MSTDREIVISRKVDAPLKIVFDAFTHPDHIGQWWGPNGFTITTKRWDSVPLKAANRP